MKKKLRLSMIVLLGIFLFLMGGIVSVQAAPYYNVVDEYGPGYWKDLDPTAADYNVWNVWNGALYSPDPWTGGQSLRYVGFHSDFSSYFDVLVKDPNGANSDMLRFSNNASYPLYTFIRFYSADTSGGAPADTGLPPESTWHIQYTVFEDANGIFYWTSPTGSQWQGYSEGRAPALAPEPATMLLLALGLMGLAGVKRKFKK